MQRHPSLPAAVVVALVAFGSLSVACGGGGGDDDDSGDDDVVADSPLVDPDCVDGQFAEEPVAPEVDISDLVASYDPGQPQAFIDAVLTRRYPFATIIVDAGAMGAFGNCITAFGYDLSSAGAVIRQMSTIVHECGHFADLDASAGNANSYYVNAEHTLSLHDGDTTERGGMTFARSRIRADQFSAAHPPCPGTGGGTCDGYAPIYLDGDPDNGAFEGGDQGFNLLFEETVQYVNSLATGLAFHDAFTGGNISERDGILNFLWFVERYLHMARLEYPAAYQHLLTGDGGAWRTAILQIWGRAWIYLGLTADIPSLGIDDAKLEGLVSDPVLVDEIQRLRDAAGC